MNSTNPSAIKKNFNSIYSLHNVLVSLTKIESDFITLFLTQISEHTNFNNILKNDF